MKIYKRGSETIKKLLGEIVIVGATLRPRFPGPIFRSILSTSSLHRSDSGGFRPILLFGNLSEFVRPESHPGVSYSRAAQG
jgi:hypothetical protein